MSDEKMCECNECGYCRSKENKKKLESLKKQVDALLDARRDMFELAYERGNQIFELTNKKFELIRENEELKRKIEQLKKIGAYQYQEYGETKEVFPRFIQGETVIDVRDKVEMKIKAVYFRVRGDSRHMFLYLMECTSCLPLGSKCVFSEDEIEEKEETKAEPEFKVGDRVKINQKIFKESFGKILEIRCDDSAFVKPDNYPEPLWISFSILNKQEGAVAQDLKIGDKVKVEFEGIVTNNDDSKFLEIEFKATSLNTWHVFFDSKYVKKIEG